MSESSSHPVNTPGRMCRYCGRVGEKQYLKMPDGQWRCKSPDYCQRRSRKVHNIHRVISGVLQGGETSLTALAGDRVAREITEALERGGYRIERGSA
jgi:hypothetical protein